MSDRYTQLTSFLTPVSLSVYPHPPSHSRLPSWHTPPLLLLLLPPPFPTYPGHRPLPNRSTYFASGFKGPPALRLVVVSLSSTPVPSSPSFSSALPPSFRCYMPPPLYPYHSSPLPLPHLLSPSPPILVFPPHPTCLPLPLSPPTPTTRPLSPLQTTYLRPPFLSLSLSLFSFFPLASLTSVFPPLFLSSFFTSFLSYSPSFAHSFIHFPHNLFCLLIVFFLFLFHFHAIRFRPQINLPNFIDSSSKPLSLFPIYTTTFISFLPLFPFLYPTCFLSPLPLFHSLPFYFYFFFLSF